ncbi:hypothetical protein BBF96_03665 [Anoxybacter fermentans]|uniref:Uncharacterized protein n=1 Tax=Anoxybacter fermentans TaxID=1323375 RepID=A0A3S9SW92_9FIRM|nr:hypothetical protein BBF96_03665 [Anoxybacter fermentans]
MPDNQESLKFNIDRTIKRSHPDYPKGIVNFFLQIRDLLSKLFKENSFSTEYNPCKVFFTERKIFFTLIIEDYIFLTCLKP